MPTPPPPCTALLTLLQKRLEQGWLSFAEYMDIVLYTPQLGYYANHQQKFGPMPADGSDFITAPEISPLFAQTVAGQLAQIMQTGQLFELLEFGAGSGRFAADILRCLDDNRIKVTRYAILEISAVLRERQTELLHIALADRPHLLNCLVWLDQLPSSFNGIMLGNEVLDAIPPEIYARQQQQWYRRGVNWDKTNKCLSWDDQLTPTVPTVLTQISGTDDYVTEIHPRAEGFIRSLATSLERGCLLLIDYGFPAAEYYHPQRCHGTIMAHYRHRAYTDPFTYPGQADLTTHINFTAIADVAETAGLTLLGYTSQANFLLNAGLTEHLMHLDPTNPALYLPTTRAVQQLVSEAEMGELFKVIAFGKNIEIELRGFSRGDRSHTL